MPTYDELNELITNCTWEWTTQNGVNGYNVTSNKDGYNDKSIFLPAAGYHDESALQNAGSVGNYWSSTPYGGDDQHKRANFLNFGRFESEMFFNSRYYGQSVRPVID